MPEIFDVTSTPQEFVQKIEDRLENPIISQEIMGTRYELFYKWVSPTDTRSLEKYASKIRELVI